MSKTSPRVIVEAGLMVAIFSVLCIITRYFPFLSILTLIFPLPFIIIYVRHNVQILLMTLFASSVIGSLVTQDFIWLFLACVAGPAALVIGTLIKRRITTSAILLAATLVTALGFAGMMQLTFSLFATPEMPANLGEYYKMIFEESNKMIQAMNLPNAEQMIQQNLGLIDLVQKVIPFIVLMAGFFISLVNILVAYKMMDRLKIPYRKPGLFRDFTLPNDVMIGVTILLVLVFAMGYFKVMDMESMMLNVIYIFQFIFSVQGMAVTYGWMLNRGFSKGAVTTLMLFLVFFASLAFVLIGWVDIIFDFRKLRKRKVDE